MERGENFNLYSCIHTASRLLLMAYNEALATYIAKLGHPLREIRERSLKLLIAKLQLGWKLDDELSETRHLLESLLGWFQEQLPTLQLEVLELLLATIKSKTGTYIVREMGIRKILSILSAARTKIIPDAMEIFQDVVETLRFLNTVESNENVIVPHLNIPDLTSSESNSNNSAEFYNVDQHIQSSKESFSSNGENNQIQPTSLETSDGIKVLLFPWVDLCSSDSKTMLLIEDALRLLKSTRRCCRFIRDVFLCDFPAEIFLNRPGIIKNLLTISEGNKDSRPGEALHVLLCITQSLRKRLLQLSCLDLIHEANKISDFDKDMEERVCTEVEQIAEGLQETPKEDGLLALRQLPAPVYALDTLHAVLSILAKNIVSVDAFDDSDIIDLKELNLSLCLVESLIGLLLDCITNKFWSADHKIKTHRDISHKSCMVMRLLGDLLMKYRNSFYDEPTRCHHRTAWFRLTSCAEKLLHWAKDSALPPSSMFVALQTAQIDPALELFYPDLSMTIAEILHSTRTPIDQEYKTKYRQLKKLFTSMDEAVKIMKNKNSCHNSKQIFTCIKNSLPILEVFQSEAYLNDIADFLLIKTKNFDMNESDWSIARNISLFLMAHNVEWVSVKFYSLLAEMVKSVLVGNEAQQMENEKCLTLLCDVSMLTEIICHGISSKSREVKESASDIILYLLRGRLVFSDSCWWRLLASLLPVLPLLHVYAAHDTHLGQAICKSLDSDIAECMGVSNAEMISGLVRLLFVRCVSVQLDAAHSLCRILDNERYLPPRESLRADVLLNALKSVKPQDFNVDPSSSPSKNSQTTGLMQILDVLKQDISLDEHGIEFECRATSHPSLEPSLRRNTLQQLSVIIRQQDLHETFVQSDGLKVIVAILRMSLMIDDYLAFPECALSCIAILNSVCFGCRHSLSKISDLPLLLVRVILIFPANESAVAMCAQILSLVAWAGFALQELDVSRHRVPALPYNVTEHTTLPFKVNSYWKSSPNAEHSYVEWLLAEEDWRAAIRVRWWYAKAGRSKVLLEAPPAGVPLALRPCARDLALLRTACPIYSSSKALLALENATSHRQVNEALNILQGYIHLFPLSCITSEQLAALPWHHTRRYFTAPPASSRDAALLVSLLHFVLAYMDNVPADGGTMDWIKSTFIGNDASIISLLGRIQLYPQQTVQDDIEMTQVHKHIVAILMRCIILFEKDNDYDSQRMESLLKILLACVERVDLRNFHMLGFLNELMRCIRYATNSRFCRLSEDTLISCLKITTRTLSGCALGSGQKGQACRLDAILTLLAVLRQIHQEVIPVQRWSEAWDNEVVYAVAKCERGMRPELRAAALHVFSSLARYAQLLPQLSQAIGNQSLSEYAARIFAQRGEASVVRAAAASLLAAVASRASPKSDVHESDVLEHLEENNFLDNCLDIIVSFCKATEYVQSFEPNISLSVLERRSELEVRAQKCADVRVSPQLGLRGSPPATAGLVAAIADVVNNVSCFGKCPVQEWNDRGLYRLLFRCASWSSGKPEDANRVRAAACRALAAASPHKCVRASLSSTKDCLHNLLTTLTPLDEATADPECYTARAQALLLLASLLESRSSVETVWQFLKESSDTFLHLILQCLEGDELELQDAALFCLTQLAQSLTRNQHADKTKVEECAKFYDNLKSPFNYADDKNRYCSGDSARNDDCQPEYMAEEICKALINLYEKLCSEDNQFQFSEEERWIRTSWCLACVVGASARSRRLGVHRRLPRRLAAAARAARDALAARGDPVLVARTADRSPILRNLYWLLTVITASMVDCPSAKESFADDNLIVSLNRLWPWCMMTDQLRTAVMQLLFNFTNDCPKAWAAMCVCVSGRSLVGEVCALCVREAALQTRARADALLLLALHTVRHCLPHHHCRAIILKSEVMSSMHASFVRNRTRGLCAAGAAWARVCVEAARTGEGAAAVLAAAGGARGAAGASLTALAPPLRARLMPAVAHAAAHHRHTFLQSPELLELLSGTLLTGDTADIVSAARAVWGLAANNHKAKLMLKSAGVAAAIQSALQRMQRAHADAATERALQLLTYTNTILQNT